MAPHKKGIWGEGACPGQKASGGEGEGGCLTGSVLSAYCKTTSITLCGSGALAATPTIRLITVIESTQLLM